MAKKTQGRYLQSVMLRVSVEFADVVRQIAERENDARPEGASVCQITRELAESLQADAEGEPAKK